MKEVRVDDSALCQRLTQGLRDARRILEEAERDCQRMFDCAVYEQLDKMGDVDSTFRREFLQKAAEEKAKRLK